MVKETKYKGYKVYSDGRVAKKRGGGFIKPHTDRKNGYQYFTPTEGPNRFHRFIWEALNGSIPNSMTIDHIDGDKLNNRLENLQLMTHADNIRKSHQLFDDKDLQTIFYLKSLGWSNRRIADGDPHSEGLSDPLCASTPAVEAVWEEAAVQA